MVCMCSYGWRTLTSMKWHHNAVHGFLQLLCTCTWSDCREVMCTWNIYWWLTINIVVELKYSVHGVLLCVSFYVAVVCSIESKYTSICMYSRSEDNVDSNRSSLFVLSDGFCQPWCKTGFLLPAGWRGPSQRIPRAWHVQPFVWTRYVKVHMRLRNTVSSETFFSNRMFNWYSYMCGSPG